MSQRKTKEAQKIQFDTYQERGPVQLGPWTSHIWRTDPRHLGFLLARYKFCAKMLAGKPEVLEVGCGDAFGTMVVLQTVGSVHGIDFEPLVIEDARTRLAAEGVERCSLSVLDIKEGSAPISFWRLCADGILFAWKRGCLFWTRQTADDLYNRGRQHSDEPPGIADDRSPQSAD